MPGKQAPVIEIRGLYKSYHTPAGAVRALDGVDLSVGAGEFTVITGKSGAGKSTLVNLLTGIDQADAGSICVAGTPLPEQDDRRARWRGLTLGVVFQFFQLLPSISLLQNVVIPMEFCGRFTPAERRDRAAALLEQVGLAEHIHKRPAEISGGQQQRVAIARALANDPPIIVADEPTGNLDSRTAAEILELFSGLVQSGKTLLVVTHDATLAGSATHRVVLADGRIIHTEIVPAGGLN